jgi:Cache 3/Cache 2 fusion domain
VNPSKLSLLALTLAVGLVAVSGAFALAGTAEDVKSAMDMLKTETATLGEASVRGEADVAGKQVPALYFGDTAMDNNFTIVDAVQTKKGGTATLFVKNGDEFVRVTTNVKKDDGSRAIGTVLDPKGKVIGFINDDESFYGDVDILGKPYTTGYEPIHDAAGKVIGIYYVGYLIQ